VFGGGSVAVGLILALVLLRQRSSAPAPTREPGAEPETPLQEAYESGVEDLVEVV
jgi:hypothetical protein